MSRGEIAFNWIVKIVLTVAFASFLLASINHVAAFFSDFEPSRNAGSIGSYGLAIAIDGTDLILMLGLMFYGRKMTLGAKAFIWLFIIGLTGFSWIVNWEYAVTYQQGAIAGHLNPFWRDVNPILASSFAFLNLAYSAVAEVFTTREPTVEELQAELDSLTGTKAQLLKQIRDNKGPGLIASLKNTALEVKGAALEVISANAPEIDDQDGQLRAKNDQPEAQNFTPGTEVKTYQDNLSLTIDFLQQSPYATEEDLAEILGLNRPASARFWRLKALEILGENLLDRGASSAPETDQIFTPLVDDQDGKTDRLRTDPALYTYSVELPDDQGTNGGHLTDIYTPNQGQPEAAASSAPAPTREEKPAKQFTGMTYKDAAKLPCCKEKNVTASDIRAAVKSGACRSYKDKSVSTHAIEEWVKTLQPVAV